MQKKIIMIIDNRPAEMKMQEANKSLLSGSAFKATQIDTLEHSQPVLDVEEEQSFLNQLQGRIITLQNRINQLERTQKSIRKVKRMRRRANQINRQFQCPFQECQKIYGTQTSLKNHLKLKHKRGGQIDSQ